MRWGQQVGAASGVLVPGCYRSNVIRTAGGLLSLSRRYGRRERLESARALALGPGVRRYRRVDEILINNRDRAVPVTPADWVSSSHARVRCPGYYQ